MNFDAGFLTRLKQRDPDACTFLVSSLTPVLEARLRYKLRDHGAIEDIRNETFYRVFCLVDGGRVRQPEQFGAFVRGVCDRVAQESCRKAHATETLPRAGMEPRDCQPHLDQLLVDKERRALVWREMMKLSEADRRIIVELHYEERDRREMARDRGVSTTGLNVRLCRAMKRLRAEVLRQAPAVQPACRPRARGARTHACRAQGASPGASPGHPPLMGTSAPQTGGLPWQHECPKNEGRPWALNRRPISRSPSSIGTGATTCGHA